MGKIYEIYEKLENAIHDQLENGIKNCNTSEMAYAFDMLKDTAETMYYKSVVDAMIEEPYAKRPERLTMDMYKEPSRMYYNEPNRVNEPRRMYYTEPTDMQEHMGKSGKSRREYMNIKTGQDIPKKVEKLEHYMNDVVDDMQEMMNGMSVEEKNILKQKLMVLNSRI